MTDSLASSVLSEHVCVEFSLEMSMLYGSRMYLKGGSGEM